MNDDTKTTAKAVMVLLSSELDMFEQGLMTPDEYRNKTVDTLKQGLMQILDDGYGGQPPLGEEGVARLKAEADERMPQAKCIPGWLDGGIPPLGEDDPA